MAWGEFRRRWGGFDEFARADSFALQITNSPGRIQFSCDVLWTSFGSWCPRIERGQKRLNDVLIASFCFVFLLSGTSKYFVGSGLLLKAVKVPIVPSHVHSINDSLSAEEAADDYEFVIRQLVRTRVVGVSDISDCPIFDLMLLGMGSDGHVASLFPNHSVLDEKDKWVTFIIDSPKPPPERITFSLSVINSSANVALVVTGSSKAQVVHLAIDDVGSECPSLPAKIIQPTKGKLVWFLDKPAASKLDDGAQFSG